MLNFLTNSVCTYICRLYICGVVQVNGFRRLAAIVIPFCEPNPVNMVHLDIYPKPSPQEVQRILADLESSHAEKVKDKVAVVFIMCIGLIGLLIAL